MIDLEVDQKGNLSQKMSMGKEITYWKVSGNVNDYDEEFLMGDTDMFNNYMKIHKFKKEEAKSRWRDLNSVLFYFFMRLEEIRKNMTFINSLQNVNC